MTEILFARLDEIQAVDPTLTALGALDGTTGLLTQLGVDIFTKRTLTGTSNRLTVTNGDGLGGNPTFDISASYVGQATITTLGTIATGVWHGTKLSEIYGGTNQNTYTLGDTLYASAADTLSKLAGNTTATRKFLRQTGNGTISAAPAWDTILAADVPGSALTKVDDTNVTLTLGGTPTSALLAAASLTLGWTGTLSIARGGTGAGAKQAAFDALAPTATRAGDLTYWDGTHYVNIAGNNSGVKVLSEDGSGVVSWAAPGSGTLTASGTPTVGQLAVWVNSTTLQGVDIGSTVTNSLGSDTALNNTANFGNGPTVAQGTTGKWWASGTVSVSSSAGSDAFYAKLWDGTTVIATGASVNPGANNYTTITLAGFISSPAGNIRIDVKDVSTTSGKILFNQTGLSKDSTVSAVRIA